MADALLARGVKLVSGGTDNHLMLVDLKEADISGRELEERLDSVHITVNKNKIPGDPRSASETSGIRVGTPAVTARGFKEAEAREVGELLALAAQDFDAKKGEILERVDALCSASRCTNDTCDLERVSKMPEVHFRRLCLHFCVDFP